MSLIDPNFLLGLVNEFYAKGWHVHPGSDRDIDLLVVDVTGTPTISWDEDPGEFDFTHPLNVTGRITLSGRLLVDNTTEATSATTGSIQTEGGLGVVKKAHFGNRVTIENTVPQLRFIDTNADIDEGDWEFVALADGSFNLRTLTEAGSAGDIAFSVTRTGTAITGLQVPRLGVGKVPLGGNTYFEVEGATHQITRLLATTGSENTIDFIDKTTGLLQWKAGLDNDNQTAGGSGAVTT